MDNTTITIYSENTPGVLYRIANLFLRRKINIESLTVSEIKNEGLSRFTIVVKQPTSLVEKVAKQLERIIEVSKVEIHTDGQLIFKEAALIRIENNQKHAQELEKVIAQLKAVMVYSDSKFIVIQKTDSEEDLDLLISTLEPFGVKEVVRSGRIALQKK